MKNIKKSFILKIGNQQGSFIVGVGIFSAVLGIAMFAIFGSGMRVSEMSSRMVNTGESQMYNQKGLSLGSYLITNNLVLCRLSGWRELKDSGSKATCKWGGEYHKPAIQPEQFVISKTGYEGESFFVTVTLGINTETTVKFDLVDWENTNQSNYSSLIGSLAVDTLAADSDKTIIVMEATTKYVDSHGQNQISKRIGGVRRPIGTPELQVKKDVNSGVCMPVCDVGITESMFPECRAASVIDASTEQILNLKVANIGPGAIFNLAYHKDVKFLEPYFTPAEIARLNKSERFSVMGEGQEEVFMPGDAIVSNDTLACAKPTSTVQEIYNRVVASGSSLTVDEVSSMRFRKYSNYKYTLTADAKVSVITPPRAIASVFTETYSNIEPRKLGSILVPSELSVNQAVTDVVKTITETIPGDPCVINPDSCVTYEPSPGGDGGGGDGGGDGGGGGDGN